MEQQVDISAAVANRLGNLDIRVMELETVLAQKNARVAELEAELLAMDAGIETEPNVPETIEKPVRLDRRRRLIIPSEDEPAHAEEPPGA